MRAQLIDISKWQGSFRPEDATQTIDGVIMRAGYGLMADPLFEIFVEAAEDIPAKGAYHYFSSGSPWEAQAEFFIKQVAGKGIHFYVLDFERGYNGKSVGFAQGAQKWMGMVAAETGRKVLLYTNPSTYNEWLLPYGYWMEMWPLWVAQWPYFPRSQTGQPRMANMRRDDWLLWQYSGDGNKKGAEYGVGSRDVDRNVYNGTAEEMRVAFGVGEHEPEPSDEPSAIAIYNTAVDDAKSASSLALDRLRK